MTSALANPGAQTGVEMGFQTAADVVRLQTAGHSFHCCACNSYTQAGCRNKIEMVV